MKEERLDMAVLRDICSGPEWALEQLGASTL